MTVRGVDGSEGGDRALDRAAAGLDSAPQRYGAEVLARSAELLVVESTGRFRTR